ncbi:hypothetical protein EJ05DRAFT_504367 [Pseudovirgaria hyperparasitica]|uniref:Copper transport protein n=1 Tax=Pseudovirgaria hyperparasitica TaxID=470096 RepID=A0A6A6VUM6_9PEZI|nr:uncharacterized protein EJ05DRAFT_504367 [Pseudovirgaria hyperparasitica]KAF2754272.1 hypothetical protein EJ05DRAFT_504367 [Pseudovirgaria hyperparasitica]
MDHSHMDHGHMDHGHMGHGGMDMPSDMCNMNMLFTWSTENLCIVFKHWHVRGTFSLLVSLLGVVLLTAGYELVRDVSRRYEAYELGMLRVGDGDRASGLPSRYLRSFCATGVRDGGEGG